MLFAADTLSNTEPPSIEGSQQSCLDYLESLETLKALIDRVDWIVPGHGNPANPSEAKKRLEMDQRYLRPYTHCGLRIFRMALKRKHSPFCSGSAKPERKKTLLGRFTLKIFVPPISGLSETSHIPFLMAIQAPANAKLATRQY